MPLEPVDLLLIRLSADSAVEVEAGSGLVRKRQADGSNLLTTARGASASDARHSSARNLARGGGGGGNFLPMGLRQPPHRAVAGRMYQVFGTANNSLSLGLAFPPVFHAVVNPKSTD